MYCVSFFVRVAADRLGDFVRCDAPSAHNRSPKCTQPTRRPSQNITAYYFMPFTPGVEDGA
ncbi:MAG: hypothetical protein FWB96_07680, partial [Defluviitaleaceae bacterium]|nr:hypothetical protein [Defluviitaleaceae bacterium]